MLKNGFATKIDMNTKELFRNRFDKDFCDLIGPSYPP